MELEEVRMVQEWIEEMRTEEVLYGPTLDVIQGALNVMADSDPSCYGAVQANLHHDLLVMAGVPIPGYLAEILTGGNGNF